MNASRDAQLLHLALDQGSRFLRLSMTYRALRFIRTQGASRVPFSHPRRT